jgi:hypothetical protein
LTRLELPFPVPLSACFINVAGRGRVASKRYLAWQTEAMSPDAIEMMTDLKAIIKKRLRDELGAK